MAILLYVAGAFVFAIGAAMIGYGIPINEFSFGNTLIIAGSVAVAGGLIVLALGVVVGRLQHLIEAYSRGVAWPVKPPQAVEAPLPPRAGPQQAPVPPAVAMPPAEPERVPFPARPKAAARVEAPPREPFDLAPPEPRDFALPPFSLPPLTAPNTPATSEPALGAPFLPNPDEPQPFDDKAFDDREFASAIAAPQPVEVAEETPVAAPEPEQPAEIPADETAEEEVKPAPIPPARRAALEKSEPSYFDAMWPAEPEREPKAGDTSRGEPVEEEPSDPKALDPADLDDKPFDDKPFDEPKAFEPFRPVEPRFGAPASRAEEPPRPERTAVPILKSGVVDGMGYTLYVDGSIEAELPQGTLRFASINELRAHLEKTP